MSAQPLAGVRVLDFSTLLPGPLCSLLLREAGASVTKIERPQGDEMRSYTPRLGEDSVNFALLNRGKDSIVIDLKNPLGRECALGLVAECDVLIEQFRPGVMQRLGLDYETVQALNPRIVYCSITGWGQDGELSQVPAHDLNYLAETGVLSLSGDVSGGPGLPPVLVADIAGGAYPAVMNILLALRQRDAQGIGSHLDIAMADNLFPLMYWALGEGWSTGRWPSTGQALVTGGSPRYQVYRTSDGRYLAAAPLEEKFWRTFLEVIGAPSLADDARDPAGVRREIERIVASRTAAEWHERFAGTEACVNVIRDVKDAAAHPHFVGRGLFRHKVSSHGQSIPALPVAVCPQFRQPAGTAASPALGSPTL